jgi:hypothetical protein
MFTIKLSPRKPTHISLELAISVGCVEKNA